MNGSGDAQSASVTVTATATGSVLQPNFVESSRGSRLYYDEDGYEYRLANGKKDQMAADAGTKVRLRCNQKACKGVADLKDGYVQCKADHNHIPVPHMKQKRKCISQLKNSKELGINAKEAVRNAIMNADERVRQLLPDERSILRFAQRHLGTQEGHRWPYKGFEEACPEFVIESNIDSTPSGDPGALVIMVHPDALDRIALSRDFFCDSTTSRVVPGFERILTFGTIHQHVFVPEMWAAMGSTSVELYERIFQFLRNRLPNLVPASLMCDFDHGPSNAFTTVFPEARIFRCCHQFAQNMWKHVQQFGLQREYGNDTAVESYIKALISLTFVRSTDVVSYFSALKEYQTKECPSLSMLFDYFKCVYVGSDELNPIYPPDQWALLDKVISGDATAIFGQDCLSRQFKGMRQKPSLSELAGCLVVEESRNRQLHKDCCEKGIAIHDAKKRNSRQENRRVRLLESIGQGHDSSPLDRKNFIMNLASFVII